LLSPTRRGGWMADEPRVGPVAFTTAMEVYDGEMEAKISRMTPQGCLSEWVIDLKLGDSLTMSLPCTPEGDPVSVALAVFVDARPILERLRAAKHDLFSVRDKYHQLAFGPTPESWLPLAGRLSRAKPTKLAP
jgi:hypothetical protein